MKLGAILLQHSKLYNVQEEIEMKQIQMNCGKGKVREKLVVPKGLFREWKEEGEREMCYVHEKDHFLFPSTYFRCSFPFSSYSLTAMIRTQNNGFSSHS